MPSISTQHKGIVLVFEGYLQGGQGLMNCGIQTYFIPKELVQAKGSVNMLIPLINFYSDSVQLCRKSITVTDKQIIGSIANTTSPNHRFVLTYVIGV